MAAGPTELAKANHRSLETPADVPTRSRQEPVGTLPTPVRSFLKDIQALDTRRAKALLQTILAAAHIYRDGRIELEFR